MNYIPKLLFVISCYMFSITFVCAQYPEISEELQHKTDTILAMEEKRLNDIWEKKYHLNPKDVSDANEDLNGDGYTNIEKYFNGIDTTKKVDWKDEKNNKDTLAKLQFTSLQ